MCDHLDDVLVLLDVVRCRNDIGEDDTDLALSLSHLMVSEYDFESYLFEDLHHFCPEVYHRVGRHNRKVTALCSWSVAHVAVVVES